MSSSSSDKSANATATYKWEMVNFASVTDSIYAPGIIVCKNVNLHLWLHPKLSVYADEKAHVVVVLSQYYPSNVQYPLSVQYQLSILGANGEKHHTRDLRAEFTDKNSVDIQYNLNWNYLTNTANGLLVNGKLTICCEAYVLNSVDSKSSLPTLDSKISQDYGSLLENGKFADVTLVVGEKDFKAHKVVLAARSPMFCAMFEHSETKESQENRVEIQDMPVDVFEQMIRFIYTDKVDSLDKYAAELLQAADRYQLDSLKSTYEQYLGTSLTVESFASIAVIADMHHAKNLEMQCIDYLIKHAKEVIKTEGWNKLVKSQSQLGCQLLQLVIEKI